MASDRQARANRRNAQKSTGPRTPEGKAKSRFNALKYGIHADQIVLPTENEDEWRSTFFIGPRSPSPPSTVTNRPSQPPCARRGSLGADM